jgi:hypothetical protein
MIDEKILLEYEQELKRQQLEADQAKLSQTRQDVMLQDQDKGMISEQLDVSEILNNMYYLLKGYVLKQEPKSGFMQWSKPETNDMIILSDYGVNYVLGVVQWYVNKNTLLSNYEDEIILSKMEDIATTLADNLFMDYENMFCQPTDEDCKIEIENRIKKKVEHEVFTKKIMGEKYDDKEIRTRVLNEMKPRFERELIVIKQQKMKSKMKRFETIMRCVQDTIHSAYNRAWKGQERRTLREHIHITESKGGGIIMANQPKFTMNPIKAMTGR